MSATELKAFLERTGLRVEDVASATGLGANTIYRFLRGKNVTRANVRAIAEFVASKSKVSPQEPKRSTA